METFVITGKHKKYTNYKFLQNQGQFIENCDKTQKLQLSYDLIPKIERRRKNL